MRTVHTPRPTRPLHASAALLLAISLAAGAAVAQESTGGKEDVTQLSDVNVTEDPLRALASEPSASSFGFAKPLLETPRSSWTAIEFPNVVDVDNDGSAEILVVSVDQAPTLRVIKDAQDRWIPARRIWNQHAYHVTNVREDGTIPAVQAPHWERLNTFRTQAQITAGGAACLPPPG